jgi:threonine dehydrogenase-like Zn-dependent dehydrogenase
VLVGLCPEDSPLNTRSIVRKEINIIGSYSYCKSDIETVKLAANKRLDLSKSITHKLRLYEVNKGIEILDKGIGNPLRVIVEPS